VLHEPVLFDPERLGAAIRATHLLGADGRERGTVGPAVAETA
jgi:hypothetical protein